MKKISWEIIIFYSISFVLGYFGVQFGIKLINEIIKYIFSNRNNIK